LETIKAYEKQNPFICGYGPLGNKFKEFNDLGGN